MTTQPQHTPTREATADRLSGLARRLYAAAGCPGAYVRLTPMGYALHEPSPNAAPIVYRTARECEAAIRAAIRTFD